MSELRQRLALQAFLRRRVIFVAPAQSICRAQMSRDFPAHAVLLQLLPPIFRRRQADYRLPSEQPRQSFPAFPSAFIHPSSDATSRHTVLATTQSTTSLITTVVKEEGDEARRGREER